MQFSKSQLEAINTSGKNIVVSASAGAGKTTVLVERLMQRMFKDRISLDEIVAMTFTEAAAANMKKKLLKALNEKLRSDIDEETRAFCQHQLILIENALICTMHSFSTTLIKNNYAAISLNPELVENIIDDVTAYKLKKEALHQVFREELASNFDNFNHLNQYISNDIHNFDSLTTVVDRIFRTAINTIDPEEWLESVIELNQPVRSFSEINDLFTNNFIKVISIKLTNIINSLEELAFLAATADQERAVLLENIRSSFLEAQSSLSFDYNDAVDKIITACNVDFKTIRKFEEFNNLRSELLKNQYPALLAILYNERKLIDDYNASAKINIYLLRIAGSIIRTYQSLKVANNCMDFNDMEHYAYQILKANDEEVARKYQNKLKEIMVDEFQDTNDTQNIMIDLISNGTNVFRVGDMKQSIYRFRSAKPTIMQSLLMDDDYHNIYLPNNFRSSYNIVEFNNSLFKDLLSDENININFTEDDRQIAELEYQFENLAPIELVNLQIDDSDDNSEYKRNYATEYIAQEIITKHLDEGYHFKDICILVRNHKSKIDIKHALNRANIPNFIDDHLGFLNTAANMMIQSFFKLIVNKYDEISLVSVLSSPLYNFSDDDLVSIRNDESFFRVLEKAEHPFVSDYYRLRDVYQNEGISELLNSILILNNYYHDYTNAQDRANIDLLSSNIEDFGSDSLIDYLNYLDIAMDNNKDGAIPVSNEDDVVRVMTIHQSKGLEFEVVYVYDPTNTSLVKKQELSIHDKLGIGLDHSYDNYKYKNQTIQQLAINYQNSIEELSEFIRIFYVATTRPKNRLYIVSKNKIKTIRYQNISSLVDKQLSFQDLIFNSEIMKSELLQVRTLTSPFEFRQLERIHSEKKQLHYYATDVRPLEKLSPSDHDDLELNLDFAARGMYIGTMIHNILEKLPMDTKWTEELLLTSHPDLTARQRKSIVSLYNDDFFQHLLSLDVHREYNFTSLEKNTLKTGIVDFMAIGDNDVYIVDYKTDANVSPDELKEKYYSQLAEYQKTFSGIFPDKAVSAYIYSLSLNEFIRMI